MSLALAKRYRDLGGEIHYDSRVEKILVENDKAVGIRLTDGSEHRAGRVVSAADGYTTIFKMLDGKYADEKTREPYEKWPVFPPLLFVGLGVNRTFENEPKTVSGFSFALQAADRDRRCRPGPAAGAHLQPGPHPRARGQDQHGGDVAQQL